MLHGHVFMRFALLELTLC